jgi:ring-1,2-phenylacetyl-CoA epoxidase subunit PaaE
MERVGPAGRGERGERDERGERGERRERGGPVRLAGSGSLARPPEDAAVREENPTVALPLVSPAHMIPVQVIEREPAAPDVVTVSIVLPGTQQAPAPYLPGQFVTLALPTPRETLYRSYSLCGDGAASQPWSLTIKRLEKGAVSTYFYHSVVAGTLLYSSLPRGTFTLPAHLRPEMTLVMVAAGSGITPIMGMLRALGNLPPDDRPLVQLHYASRSVDDIIFGEELADLDPDVSWLRQWHYLSSEGNRMRAEAILARAGTMARRSHWYMCGPDALKRQLQEQLGRVGTPPEQVHSEIFATAAGPAYKLTGGPGAATGGRVLIAETGAELDVEPQETLLVALERHGYRPEFSCRAGACGACKLRVLDGQAEPIGEALSNAERAAGYVLSCIARPVGAVTLASGGRPPAGVVRRAIGVLPAAAASRRGAVRLTRVATLASAGVLLLSSWNLTDHRPASWDTVAAAASSGQPAITATSGATASAQPTATTSSHGTGGGGKPTVTATKSAGGGPPAPTATSGAATPTPTPRPTPTPTATSKPS